MREIKVNVDKKFATQVQRAGLEVDSRSFLLERMMKTYAEDPSFMNSPLYKAYHEAYSDAFMEFEMYKTAITDKYMPEYLKEHSTEWNLDYNTCEMTIKILCDCDIPELEAC